MRPNVFAYCGRSQRLAVAKAAGVMPLTCPPITAEYFKREWLERPYDLLYFSLHGLPEQPYWYGDKWITAITAEQFAGLDLSETVVFAANCYLEGSPMEKAVLDCHAKALVGGSGRNWTRAVRLVGANLLGWYFRRLLLCGFEASNALHLAKLGVKGKNAQIKNRVIKRDYDDEDYEANRDAMAFKVLKTSKE
jgi:hypothetical protein